MIRRIPCTENDNVIQVHYDPDTHELDELWFADCREHSWLIIGINDLRTALQEG